MGLDKGMENSLGLFKMLPQVSNECFEILSTCLVHYYILLLQRTILRTTEMLLLLLCFSCLDTKLNENIQVRHKKLINH